MSEFNIENVLKNKPRKDYEISTHISLPNKYVFVQVSKAASSSVKWALQSLEFSRSPWDVIDVNNKFFSPHISPYQLDDELLLKVFASDEYKRVSFVRNPYTRLLSCYLHRIVAKPRSASNAALMMHTGGRGGSDVSFDEFVEIVCGQESKKQEAHWRCQSDDLCFQSVKYDFVGKLESLSDDLRFVVKLLYGDRGLDWYSNSKLVDASPVKTGSSMMLEEYYNNETTIKRVVDRFSADFELFGYSTELDEATSPARRQ